MSSKTAYKAGVLTVSDRASQDASFDKSGPFLKEFLSKNNYSVEKQAIVPDELHDIQKVIEQWTDLSLDLILITGGTGFSKRDKTPEAVKPLLSRETPGITHLLLQSSINITPFAALSRPVTGIRDNTMIVTLPGSVKACQENMEAIIKVLPHGLDLLLNKDVTKTHEKIQQSTGHHHKKGHQCVHKHDVEGHPSQTGRTVPLGTPVSGRARSSPYALLPVTKAQEIISQHAQRLNTVIMPISQYLPSFVLAEDVLSTEPVPGYRASIVDGYAVYAEDGPGTYSIESVSLASVNTKTTILTRGRISRVATGGMVPNGANAVVMIEDTKLVSSNDSTGEEIDIEILTSVSAGDNIREVGSDCAVGETIGFEGQRISTVGGDLGALASGGVRHVKVFRKPRVGVVSTGNEVTDVADTLKPGQVRDTNRLTLLSAIQMAGFEPVDLGIVEDNVEKLEEGLSEALEQVDVLITTGGVSMGESDFMKPILEQKLGATIHFGRVMMKPGKPTTFATIPQGKKRPPKLIFALPGNPVSAIVTFHLFVVSALKKMAGYSKYENVIVPVKVTHSIPLDPRPEYHRVQVIVSLTEGLTAASTGKQQSSRLLSMLEANGLLQLPSLSEDKKEVKAGEILPCIIIGSLHPAI